MFMWRVVMAMGGAVAAVVAAPGGKLEAREDSSVLPVEHRYTNTTSTTPHPVDDLMDALLQSETISAVDEAAARLTSAFGTAVEDLGDFVIGTVKDLPNTIRNLSSTVNKAVADGSERVVIVVKGLRNGVTDTTVEAGQRVTNTVDRVYNAANTSQTVSSFKDLQERIAVTMGRIFATFVFNLDKIDSAMADSIRQASGGKPGIATSNPVRVRPSEENEIGKSA
ncbi:hypothetical protein OTU49_001868 [Cherax quadricarinatus]|uniref:Secreted protein n=1 Tax=Cherax quadricarinatus TaxID=27406 RepID=A0AAW0YC79_CHEQU